MSASDHQTAKRVYADAHAAVANAVANEEEEI